MLPFLPALRRSLGTSLAVLLVMPAAAVAQGDTARGELLYENHCRACHTSTVHVRGSHKARTETEVEGRVRHWSTVRKLGWSADEVDDVTAYLMDRYYTPRPRPSTLPVAPPGARKGERDSR